MLFDRFESQGLVISFRMARSFLMYAMYRDARVMYFVYGKVYLYKECACAYK